MAPSPLLVERDADRVDLRLNRPDKHNAMNLALLDAVVAQAARLKRDRRLRSVVLSGNGPSFCSGLDFPAVMAKPLKAVPAMAQLWLPWINRFQRWSLEWRRVGAPVVAAVHGNCFGAGLQLALGADLRVAAPDARLSVMETRWGLVPDMGGMVLLRELLPIDVAKELTLSARVIDGRQAHALGLVSHLADDPLARATELAEELSAASPDAVAAGKFGLQDAWSASIAQAAAAERYWQRRVIGRANQRVSAARAAGKTGREFLRRSIRR